MILLIPALVLVICLSEFAHRIFVQIPLEIWKQGRPVTEAAQTVCSLQTRSASYGCAVLVFCACYHETWSYILSLERLEIGIAYFVCRLIIGVVSVFGASCFCV